MNSLLQLAVAGPFCGLLPRLINEPQGNQFTGCRQSWTVRAAGTVIHTTHHITSHSLIHCWSAEKKMDGIVWKYWKGVRDLSAFHFPFLVLRETFTKGISGLSGKYYT